MREMQFQTSALLIRGGAGSGKTARLIQELGDWIATSAPDRRALVLCATPLAAQEFERRVAEALGGKVPKRIIITTARAFALDVLATPEVLEFTGRKPCLILEYEYKFIAEDLKLSGLRPRRLKEMLRFFFRSWTELEDDNPDWLLRGDETEIHGFIKQSLAFYGRMLEPEVSNLAVNALRMENMTERYAYDLVLADDYQVQSRASQILASMVASQRIIVAGDENACAEAYDSYPYAKGLDEFVTLHVNAQEETLTSCHLPQGISRALGNLEESDVLQPLHTKNAQDAPEKGFKTKACKTPRTELAAIRSYVKDALDAQTPLNRILVAAPNASWQKNLALELMAAGIPAAITEPEEPIRGDIRENERCQEARFVTLLALAADPDDAMSWRAWTGFGDYVANTGVWYKLRLSAYDCNETLPRILDIVAKDPELGVKLCREHSQFEDVGVFGDLFCSPQEEHGLEEKSRSNMIALERVLDCKREADSFLKKASGMKGIELLEAIAAEVYGPDAKVPELMDRLCLDNRGADNASSDDATVLYARMRKRMTEPALTTDAINIVRYDQLMGLSPELLVLCGYVNGFFPSRNFFDLTAITAEQETKMRATDLKRAYIMISKPSRQLIVTTFGKLDLEDAERIKLQIARIYLEDGKRMAQVEPSIYLVQMGREP